MNNPVEENKVKQIQRLAEESEAARHFFQWSASRQRDAAETTVERAANIANADYVQMREFFRDLSILGLGDLITGRKGHKTRMKWNYSLRSIGKAGMNEISILEDINVSDVEPHEPEEDEVGPRRQEMIEHTFKFRPDVALTMRLPRDLNAREAERIAAWVRTIPYE